MQAQPGSMPRPTAKDSKRPGRGFVITGIAMMVVAVVGVVLAAAILGGSIDVEGFERDVATNGAPESEVPGRVGFRVIEDLSSGDETMTVGVASNLPAGALDCRIVDVSGEVVDLRPGSVSDSFASGRIDADWEAVAVAEDLPAGEYSAECEAVGEPSQSNVSPGPAPAFGVGRVVTAGEVFETVKPVFGIFAAIAIGGLIGLIGLILLIVGLVMGNRSRKGPPGPPGTPGSWGPPQPQPQWGPQPPQGQWGRPPPGQGGLPPDR